MLPCGKNEKITVMLSMRNIGLLIKSLSGLYRIIVFIVIIVIMVIHSHSAEGRELPKQQISSSRLGTNYEGARSEKCSESDHFLWGVNDTCLSCNSVCDNIMVPYNNDKFCLDNCQWRKCHPINEFYHPQALICLSCSSICKSLTSEQCINFCPGYRTQFNQHNSTGRNFSTIKMDNSQGSIITDSPAQFSQHTSTTLTSHTNTLDQSQISSVPDHGSLFGQRTSNNIIVDANSPDNSQTLATVNSQGTFRIVDAVIIALTIIIAVIIVLCGKSNAAYRRWLHCKDNNGVCNNDEESKNKRLRVGQQNSKYGKAIQTGVQETGVQGNTFITRSEVVPERTPFCKNEADFGNTIPKSTFDEDETRQSEVSEECSYDAAVKFLSGIKPNEEPLIDLQPDSVE